MRDEQYRLAALHPDALQLGVHLLPRQGVERAERLVHEQQIRIVDERAAEADALLHPAGQLVRVCVFEPIQPDELDQFLRGRSIILDIQAADFDLQQDVAQGGAPRHQHRVLEHNPDRGRRSANRLAVHADDTAGRRDQSRHQL